MIFLALSKFCVPWKLVGKHLRLSDAQLSAIDADKRDTKLKRIGVLEEWKETMSFKATYKVLVTALFDCGMADQTST